MAGTATGLPPLPAEHYNVLRSLASDGRIVSRRPNGTGDALQQLGLDHLDAPDSAADALLLDAAKREQQGPFLCLRCRGSWPLEQQCAGWYRQYRQSHGLELSALAGFALDDTGQSQPFQLPDGEGQRASPFLVEVVRSWNPERSGLPHWARTRLEGRNDLKRFLREHGILLIGDWALLGDCSQVQVRRAMELAGRRTDLTAEEAATLHARYRPAYRRAKLIHLQRTHRQQGWEPGDAFLKELEPTQPISLTYARLKGMAQALRTLISGTWQGHGLGKAGEDVLDPWDNLADSSPAPIQLLERQEELSLGNNVRQVLHEAGHTYWKAMVAAIPASEREQQLCFWRCWLTGASSRRIAECCGAPQARVSRRMRVEARAEEVALTVVERLSQMPDFQEMTTDVARMEAAAKGLVNHLLHPEQEGGESPLRQMVRVAMEEKG